MKIKTQSGVNILVESSGSSRTVFFDKPVRTIELTKDEALQVASLLVDGINTRVGANVKGNGKMKYPLNRIHCAPRR